MVSMGRVAGGISAPGYPQNPLCTDSHKRLYVPWLVMLRVAGILVHHMIWGGRRST